MILRHVTLKGIDCDEGVDHKARFRIEIYHWSLIDGRPMNDGLSYCVYSCLNHLKDNCCEAGFSEGNFDRIVDLKSGVRYKRLGDVFKR